MTEKDTPLFLVQRWVKRIPGCYDDLDKLVQSKLDHSVTMLEAVSRYIVRKKLPQYTGREDEVIFNSGASFFAHELTACWLWRKNKVIYSFDGELISLLRKQAQQLLLTATESGEPDSASRLPVELLAHPPYPIIYIKAPGMLAGIDGFFYWVDNDELQIVCVKQGMSETLPTTGMKLRDETIGECVRNMFGLLKAHIPDDLKSFFSDIDNVNKAMLPIFCATQLMLYLIAQNADISDDQPYRKPRRVIQDRFNEVHSYSVGVRIGATIRSLPTLRNAGGGDGVEGSPKRPHARRGHWHNYWTGPRNGKRQLVLRWVAPMFIHGGEFDEVTVHPVKV